MLKFNAWPPEPGEIEFTEGAKSLFSLEAEEIETIGEIVGGLLIANMQPVSFDKVIHATWQLAAKMPEEVLGGSEVRDAFLKGVMHSLIYEGLNP